ncbi:MAG: MFS transporter [Clostridia bacterium]|nr:MFS transporter [Clostridia bacterium]
MNTQSKTRARLRLLAFFCCLAYFASYVTRINYIAVRLAIADELALTLPELVAELGIAISAASVTYGIGQFASGILGDRLPPIALVCAGLGGAVLCNLLMPMLYPSVYLMALVWGINGFFQSLIRPPLGRIISANYDEKGYIDTCVAVSNSSQIATVLTYLVIPLCLRLFDGEWRLAFYLPVAVGVITLGFWCLLVPRLCAGQSLPPDATDARTATGKPEPILPTLVRSGLWIMLPAVLIHGLLRDGITAWMPDFISEVGGLGTSVSILTTAILPLFCIVCVLLAKKLCAALPSDGVSAALLFAVCALSAAIIVPLLNCVNRATFAVTVILMALITGCMHGVNHIFITRIPGAFKQAGRVSGVVGILNAITYLGGALSPYAVAYVAGWGGWGAAVTLWVALALLSTLLCFASRRKWTAFKNRCANTTDNH